ncbi:cytochrome c [Poseidonocella pacifica]|uniref:Cytochrome c n=1 Tax=Poseidonocella pacifica TaxID=871651 RepID=A0A1I0WR14_9RHOB|nr:c-type cytochrome [Poseidonocella pacifica]SFA91199.1 cytochrome c [Poseidonocella pacifica]
MRNAGFGLVLSVLPYAAAAEGFATLKGHGGPIMDIAVNPRTDVVASASFDNSIGLWTETEPAWREGHDAAVVALLWLPDGRLVSGGDDFDIILWGDSPQRLEGHKGKVASLALSPKADLIASASWDGTIGLWPVGGGPPRFLEGHDGAVNDVAFSARGELLSASADGTIRVWDIASGEGRVLLGNGFGINRLAVDRAGKWLAFGAVDGATRVVSLPDAAPLKDFSFDRRPILAMDQSPSVPLLAVGDGHGYIMVIDTALWRIVHDFHATLRGPIWALSFSSDGDTLYAGGIEDIVYSWPVDGLQNYEPVDPAPRSFQLAPETMGNGERQFQRKCSVCHDLSPGPSRRAGPSLYQLFGRPAGALPDYPYSDTLDAGDLIWTAETIDALFDLGPEHYIPGSKMPMQRITEQKDRDDLIEFLKTATAPQEN